MTEMRPAQPLLVTVEAAAQLLNIGRTKLYALIKREGLPVERFGRSVRIDPDRLKEWIENRRIGGRQ